ncbi:MAG: hypothetical protein HYW48_00110 [Deltaproteobacteria bacterium]|nr:hypothetical protein [Deltaproteobacteria bacterium]
MEEYGKDKWHNVSILNNGTYGIYLKQGNNTYSQMLNAGNGQYAIYEYSAEWHAHRYTRFTGVNLYSTSSTAGCYILYTPDGYNGSVACSAFGVYNQNPTFIWDVNATDLMNTYITSNDTSNSSDTDGAATFSTSLTFDWHNFLTPTRSWGKAGNSSYINSLNRGYWSSGTGRIWEWGYASTSALLNISDDGDGTPPNEDFVNGGTCPSRVHGDQYINFMFSAPGVTPIVEEPYLKAAVEVLLDNIGDDDGLCETNEACIYAPNIGYYQGHGDYTTQTCIFEDGTTITGVTMYAYPTNGR